MCSCWVKFLGLGNILGSGEKFRFGQKLWDQAEILCFRLGRKGGVRRAFFVQILP